MPKKVVMSEQSGTTANPEIKKIWKAEENESPLLQWQRKIQKVKALLGLIM